MLARLAKASLRAAGWCALAYLGYWLAVLIDDLLLRLAVYPSWGAPVLDWRLTPFRALVNNGDLSSLGAPVWLRRLLPLLPDLLALALLGAAGRRIRSALLRAWLHLAGLWIVLFLAFQAGLLGYLNRGRFAPLASSLDVNHAPAMRMGFCALLFLLLLVLGSLCARRLFAALPQIVGPWGERNWARLLLLIFPVVVILSGIFQFRFELLGPRGVLFLGVPAGACLLIGILGLRGLEPAGTVRAFSPAGAHLGAPLPRRGCGVGADPRVRPLAGVLCCAGVLFFGLEQANRTEVLLLERGMSSFSSPHYEIRYDEGHFSREFIRAFAEERERVLEREIGRLRAADDESSSALYQPVQGTGAFDALPASAGLRLRVVLYSDFASERAATDGDRPYAVQDAVIRAVLHGYVQRLDPAADAAALLEALWGPASSPLVRDWVSQLLAGEWRGRNLEDWAARVESEVGHYPLAALLETNAQSFVSPLVRTPLGAEWLRLVYDQRGLSAVRKLYSSPNAGPYSGKQSSLSLPEVAALLGPPKRTPEQLEQDWTDWTRQLLATRPPRPTARRPLPAGFFFRGISFSHEGWGGRSGGYTSPEAAQQLRVLHQMGANSISVVPYGFLRRGSETSISYAFTDETDEELTQAAYEAHQLGMRVMLKPQVWGPAGMFTGQIRFDDPAKRALWMQSYREFLLHYARLAELEGFDLLCVGNELEGLTVHAEEWRKLIGEVRRVYHGPITYAANWGREFENLRFWDALDYMGLNNYYPLAKALAPRDEEVLAGARALAARLEDLSRKWQRPILLTEVGYPSVHGAAAEPWVEDPRRGLEPEEQAACYRAIFAAFAGQPATAGKPWLGGMFWWKWPSHGRGGGASDPSYTPLGKPAAEVLRDGYTRMAAASGTSP